MNLEQWIVTFRDIYNRHDKTWSKEKERILRTTINIPESTNALHKLKKVQLPNSPEVLTQQPPWFDHAMIESGIISLSPIIPEEYQEVCTELANILTKEFFRKVSDKDTFGSEARLGKEYELYEFLSNKYSVSHARFLDMARVFCTFQFEIGDLFPEHHNVVLSQILNSVHTGIKGIFFPSDGPYKFPLQERLKAQEEILKLYAPTFDREAFFKNNPVLNKLKADEVKWPGFVYILVFSIVAWFVPQNVWWGEILFYILMGLIVICLYGVSKTIKTWIFAKGN